LDGVGFWQEKFNCKKSLIFIQPLDLAGKYFFSLFDRTPKFEPLL
jgi:hypothetical protein